MVENVYLAHHGVKGMKWGVRRYQNYDGTLINPKQVKKIEKKAIKREYKRGKKSGEHGFIFKSSRTSTGSNYNKVYDELINTIKSDKKYRELSKKAFDAEKKRLLSEKKVYDKDGSDLDYTKLINTKEYEKLYNDSYNAEKRKSNRVRYIEKQYVDKVKEAKLSDMRIVKNRDKAKKYVDGVIRTYYDDMNLEFNYDNYYEPWVDKKRFK